MRIRGRWVLPPDVESSTLQPLPPLPHPQPQLQPSPPPTKSFISFEQDALIGTGEDEDTAKGKKPVAPRPCRSTICRIYDCNSNSEVAADIDSSISSSSSHDGRWLEADKALPLKKRRFVQLDLKGKGPSNTSLDRDSKNSIETRAKRKRTEKIWTDYVLQVNWVAEKTCRKTGKMNKRCNRHNGKGWRCSLPAFAGHNLCEHHLTEQKKKTRKK